MIRQGAYRVHNAYSVPYVHLGCTQGASRVRLGCVGRLVIDHFINYVLVVSQYREAIERLEA